MSVRFYGPGPYSVAVVHGGPGAPGSVAALARGISAKYGVLEPMQSQYSVEALVDELRAQLLQYGAAPVALIGHSWGAWLAGLTAARYPELVSMLVLVACGPLLEKYVPEIGERRQRNMSPETYLEYKALLRCLDEEDTPDKDRQLSRLGEIAGKADGYNEVEDAAEVLDALPADSGAYAALMPEVMRLRAAGQLLDEFRRIQCPVVLIQGENDSHPYTGVTEPLSGSAVNLQAHILEKCGHTPWRERYAKDAFYQVLFEELDKII